jgi:N,N'-diacetyllegionaminate synthase
MKTFVIAEAGINHDGCLERAKNMIEAAKECECSAIKFQSYFTEKRVEKSSPIFDILKRCELSFDQQKELKAHADKVGIEFFSTPFDVDSLKFLVDDLGLRRIKVASFDITNKKFLDAINEYGSLHHDLNVIMSTGMSNSYEISQAIDCFKNVPYLTLLHCVSAYPTHEKEVNLEVIRTLRHMVHGSRQVGYSDHTDEIFVPASAVLVGATMIEKHFILDKNGPGVDAAVSADPAMMKNMIGLIKYYESILGSGEPCLRNVEKGTIQFRRQS